MTGEVVLAVDEEEWAAIARRLRGCVAPDERNPFGNLGVVLGAGRRRWFSTDSRCLVVFDAGEDDGDATLVVSPRLVEAWPLVSDGTGVAALRQRRHGDRVSVSLEGPGGKVSTDAADVEHLSLDPGLDVVLDQPGIDVTVDAEALFEALRVVSLVPAGPFLDDDADGPPLWLTASDDRVHLHIDWDGLGVTRCSVPARTNGEATVATTPPLLHELLMSLEPGAATFTLPTAPDATIRVVQGRVTAALWPLEPAAPLRTHVEEVLTGVFGDDVVHDEHGVYSLSSDGVHVQARINDDDPARLVVAARVLDGVAADEELLMELNQLNSSAGLVKVLWQDAAVALTAELVAATLDDEEIAAVHQQIVELADGLGPMLAIRFGGTAPCTGRRARRERLRRLVLHAELSPGVWSVLDGPDATDALPVPGPMYVLSAQDPHGRVRPAEVNQMEHGRLGAHLVHTGAGFVRAVLSDDDAGPTGTEPDRLDAFLVWDIDHDDAIELAGEFGQEAVIQLTSDRVALIGVGDPWYSERRRRVEPSAPRPEPG